jgi:hypothetical protein
MDSEWLAKELGEFIAKIDEFQAIHHGRAGRPIDPAALERADALDDELTMFEPLMRQIMEAAQPGLGNYEWTASW